jgi:predicted peptidase
MKIRLILAASALALAGWVMIAVAGSGGSGALAATTATPKATKSGAATKSADAAATATDTAAADAKPAPTFDEAMADPNRKVAFIQKTVRLSDGKDRGYMIWIPLDYDATKKWPIILFLHGSGESGTDPQKVLVQGVPKEIKRRQGKFEFIVVMPQSTGGWSGLNEEVALKAMKATGQEYSVDPARVYLTGLSMGGFGSFEMARSHPKAWAAVVACSGGGGTTVAPFAATPFWIWHSDDDGIVKVSNSRDTVTALVKIHAVEVRYTEVHGAGHASWDRAYTNDDVWAWLLTHKLTDLGKTKPVAPIIDAPTWPEAPKVDAAPAPTPTKAGRGTASRT